MNQSPTKQPPTPTTQLPTSTNQPPTPTNQLLWDRAYSALGKDHPQLVKEYEELLLKELQTKGTHHVRVLTSKMLTHSQATSQMTGLLRDYATG